jgi:hypothetical protein
MALVAALAAATAVAAVAVPAEAMLTQAGLVEAAATPILPLAVVVAPETMLSAEMAATREALAGLGTRWAVRQAQGIQQERGAAVARIPQMVLALAAAAAVVCTVSPT